MALDLFVNEPLFFPERGDLVQYLRSSIVADGVADFLKRRAWSLDGIAHRSVDSSTVRAIHTGKFGVKPLKLIRSWARAYLERHWRTFVDARDAETYQMALDDAVAALQADLAAATELRARQQQEAPYALTYGRAVKMINLMLKHVALLEHENLSVAERRAFFGRVHVALDRYTLAPLAQLAPEFGLPPEPSMGDVRQRDTYLAMQRWIAVVCADAGVPPSTYEVGLFNLPRGEWDKKPSEPDLSDVPAGVRPMAPASRPAPRSASRPPSGPPVPPVASGSVSGARGQRAPRRTPQDAPDRERRLRASVPKTAPGASVVAHRAVTHALAIETTTASLATHRLAPITGYLEVVDHRDLARARDESEPRTVRAYLTWFGQAPQRGFVQVTLNGPCVTHEDFSGDVVDDLAYAGEHPLPSRREIASAAVE